MSVHQWNFDLPARSLYSIGQYFTEYPWARNVMVIVVTHEKPAGSWLTYCRATSRRNARRPELRSGIVGLRQVGRELADEPLGRHPERLVGALLGRAGADHLVVALHLSNELGDEVVRIRHVDVGPHDDPAPAGPRAVLAGRARAAVLPNWISRMPSMARSDRLSRRRSRRR